MENISHLIALQARLSHEFDRLAKAKKKQEKELRTVWVSQIEKEIAHVKKFLGIQDVEAYAGSDDDLLKELLG